MNLGILVLNPAIKVRAIKPIKKGEEILVNYVDLEDFNYGNRESRCLQWFWPILCLKMAEAYVVIGFKPFNSFEGDLHLWTSLGSFANARSAHLRWSLVVSCPQNKLRLWSQDNDFDLNEQQRREVVNNLETVKALMGKHEERSTVGLSYWMIYKWDLIWLIDEDWRLWCQSIKRDLQKCFQFKAFYRSCLLGLPTIS